MFASWHKCLGGIVGPGQKAVGEGRIDMGRMVVEGIQCLQAGLHLLNRLTQVVADKMNAGQIALGGQSLGMV